MKVRRRGNRTARHHPPSHLQGSDKECVRQCRKRQEIVPPLPSVPNPETGVGAHQILRRWIARVIRSRGKANVVVGQPGDPFDARIWRQLFRDRYWRALRWPVRPNITPNSGYEGRCRSDFRLCQLNRPVLGRASCPIQTNDKVEISTLDRRTVVYRHRQRLADARLVLHNGLEKDSGRNASPWTGYIPVICTCLANSRCRAGRATRRTTGRSWLFPGWHQKRACPLVKRGGRALGLERPPHRTHPAFDA